MTSPNVHNALLRPAVLQILRAAGFNYTRPAVLDTVTDLAARYLLLLASSAAQNSLNTHNDYVPTVQDVRLALFEAGALRPQLSVLEEQAKGAEVINGETIPFEDLRGIEAFISWAQGTTNKEIRRIAGFDSVGEVSEIAAGLEDQEDYVTALKKRQSKTGEESRYRGSVLGKDAETQNVLIVGGPATNLGDWRKQSRKQVSSNTPAEAISATASSGISSVLLTPVEAEVKRSVIERE